MAKNYIVTEESMREIIENLRKVNLLISQQNRRLEAYLKFTKRAKFFYLLSIIWVLAVIIFSVI